MSSHVGSLGTESARPTLYVAVIGDIVASRQIPDRWRFQEDLKRGLKALSARAPALVSPWTITLGDEFQAVFAGAEGLMSSLWGVQRILQPQRARLSLGIGHIDTAINPDAALGMDGPAFHRARRGMLRLKDDERRLFAVHADDEAPARVEDVLNLAAEVVYGGRSGSRLELLAELLQGRSPQDIAGADASELRRIQKLRQRGGLRIVIDALANAAQDIDALCKGTTPH